MKPWTLLTVLSASAGLYLGTRRPRLELAGATAVITGGSRGLGLVMARELVAAGAHVTILARRADELERARGELAAAGGDVLAAVCDVTDRDAVACAMSEVLERRGRVDLLINNAGIIQVGPLDHMGPDDFEAAMRTHFWGPLVATLAVVPAMRRQGGGRIVNISSIGGRVGVPHMAPYCASKFALTGLSSALAAELARDGIYVTTVCPGLMRTGSHVNAQVKGRHGAEFAWFAMAASAPVIALDAGRAARRILAAAVRGQPHIDVGWTARLAAIAAGVAPSLVARMAGVAQRLLPRPTDGSGDARMRGGDTVTPWSPSRWTRLGDEASTANNELHGVRPS